MRGYVEVDNGTLADACNQIGGVIKRHRTDEDQIGGYTIYPECTNTSYSTSIIDVNQDPRQGPKYVLFTASSPEAREFEVFQYGEPEQTNSIPQKPPVLQVPESGGNLPSPPKWNGPQFMPPQNVAPVANYYYGNVTINNK